MLLWSTDPLLDLVKPDTLGSGLEGKVIGRGATATGRGTTLTVLVCPTADWTAEVILGWRVARILAIRSDWERLLLCLDAETPLETPASSTPARGPSQPRDIPHLHCSLLLAGLLLETVRT